jgi:integrase
VKLKLKRPGLSFYALRHSFEIIGGASGDRVAVDAIMGHTRDDMASVYCEELDDGRLRSVTDYVRNWLFGSTTTKKPRSRKTAGDTAA